MLPVGIVTYVVDDDHNSPRKTPARNGYGIKPSGTLYGNFRKEGLHLIPYRTHLLPTFYAAPYSATQHCSYYQRATLHLIDIADAIINEKNSVKIDP